MSLLLEIYDWYRDSYQSYKILNRAFRDLTSFFLYQITGNRSHCNLNVMLYIFLCWNQVLDSWILHSLQKHPERCLLTGLVKNPPFVCYTISDVKYKYSSILMHVIVSLNSGVTNNAISYSFFGNMYFRLHMVYKILY